MPRAKTVYCCTKCNKEYSSETQAEKCESNHKEVKSTLWFYGMTDKYPHTIQATFEDNKTINYVQEKSL